jgi:hypothetical protein
MMAIAARATTTLKIFIDWPFIRRCSFPSE